MNKIEQNMVESMSETIDKLKNELSMTRQDYEALLEEVFYFFKNVKTGSDLEESIEEFVNCFLTVLVAGLELFAVAFGVYTMITSL